jgi:hypothetical protein
MDVSSIASLYRTQPVLQTSALTSTDPSQKALAVAAARLDQQQQATSVQISAYGRVAAGFSKIEDAGKALAAGKPAAEAADIRKGLQALVDAYNETRTAAAATDPGSASTAAYKLLRAASNDSNRADLSALGISRQIDGALVLDSKALDSALQSDPGRVRSAAERVGGQLQQTASDILKSSGSIGSTLSTLNARASKNSETRQSIATASDQTIQQQSYGASNGLYGTSNLYGTNSGYGANGLSGSNNLFGMSYLYGTGDYYGPSSLYGISSYQNISSLFSP